MVDWSLADFILHTACRRYFGRHGARFGSPGIPFHVYCGRVCITFLTFLRFAVSSSSYLQLECSNSSSVGFGDVRVLSSPCPCVWVRVYIHVCVWRQRRVRPCLSRGPGCVHV